ncbi:MAG: protease modulator HflC [Gemmataceae bacterium]
MNPEQAIIRAILVVVLIVAVLVLLPAMFYVVDERELAVVLQFGNPVAERTEPGLYIKIPFIQTVRKFPSTRQFWGDRAGDSLPDLPTKDDKKIEVIPWAVWRVNKPTVFMQRLRTMDNGEQLVAEFVRSAVRDVITQYELIELVRDSSRTMETTAGMEIDPSKMLQPDQAAPIKPGEQPDPEQTLKMRKVHISIKEGRGKILAKIKEEVQRRLASGSDADVGRGIEVIDVGISQIEFVESVRRSTFDRWIAERQAISALFVNEGVQLKQEILNRTNAEVQKIEGEGQRDANQIRGEVDAEIIRDYAAAIEKAGDFYYFVRMLEAYKRAIGHDTNLILTTDSEFLRLFKSMDGAPLKPPPVGTTVSPGN